MHQTLRVLHNSASLILVSAMGKCKLINESN